MVGYILTAIIVAVMLSLVGIFIMSQYRKTLREAKNYERGLKMIPMYIHIPPASDDLDSGGRDERDVTEEVLSQSLVMYNIIAGTSIKGFKSRIYGQRHISFEIIAHDGMIHYYAVVPFILLDVVKQAIAAAYPMATLEEVADQNIFSQTGKIAGTVGGEFTLKKSFVHPIATYQESKRDASRALLNALATVGREDGAAIQIMFRPAYSGWNKKSSEEVSKIEKGDHSSGGLLGSSSFPRDIMSALWKSPDSKHDDNDHQKKISSVDQNKIDAIEEKTRYAGYEVLVRTLVSSPTAAKSQTILKNIIGSFALFDSPTHNGFKFNPAKNIEELVTSYIFRFFPQSINQNILNSVELATVFHLPNQKSIPTSQVKRQSVKQVDGPAKVMDSGLLLGYNEFRGTKKEIRLDTDDRRRHTYIIGSTGTGKSVLLENLAYQDMLDGRGLAFVDPHGDVAEKLLGMVPKERVEDVVYFSPGEMDHPIGLNLFEFKTPDQRDFLIQESIAMLYKLYDPGHTGIMGPMFEHWFRNAALTAMSGPTGGTFIDLPQLFNDQAFADEKLKHVTDRTVLDFWHKEMAQTSDARKSEILGWFSSKFGAFLSNEMMRNIIGQTKSGLNLREIMDQKKIFLVNLSKGLTGELNSQLLGMIFVMKFQVAAMSRNDTPENEREDFTLYVDEFQNFATDSFATILSEARKYRLSLILANQFISQLTESVRDAVIGNVGTVISGRVGIDDAELLERKFTPTFEAEDIRELPNYHTITSVMLNGVPSSPFSMSLIPPMAQPNPQLRDALRKLSAVKYGRPRDQVEREIFSRLGAGDAARKAKLDSMKRLQQDRFGAIGSPAGPAPGMYGAGGIPASGPIKSPAPQQSKPVSFLDEWIAKKQQMTSASAPDNTQIPKLDIKPKPQAVAPIDQPSNSLLGTKPDKPLDSGASTATRLDDATNLANQSDMSKLEPSDEPKSDKLHIRNESDDEVSIKLR